MKYSGHGILNHNRLLIPLIGTLWLITLFYTHSVFSAPSTGTAAGKNITLIYSSDSSLQSRIAEKLKVILLRQDKTLNISKIISPEPTTSTDTETDLVITIDVNRADQLDGLFHNTGKLFIASNPAAYSPDEEAGNRKAVLFMTQPYCRQVRLIKLINSKWHTLGYLNNRNNPQEISTIQRCAEKLQMNTYRVDTSSAHLTSDIKDLLSNADLILAMPDGEIYNSKTVKNILLTSYRHRKPVIAFSQNFVNAGALASIHSTTEQIAETAATLVLQYFSQGKNFNKRINYPAYFEISFNKQVFRALDLLLPDPLIIKQAIELEESNKTDKYQ